ncbi:unnamed protein product, partial [Sphacelaria rigidula]
MPLFIITFGETLDELGEIPDPDAEPQTLADSVADFVVLFAIFGAVAMVAGAIMVTSWSVAGERQALRIRRAYVRAILRQDIGWFDDHPAGQLPTAVTANMAKVQDGIGRKVGDIV